MANQYDVVVIGAGPGGYVAAIRAAQLGLKAAIVEKQFMGGVCLNIGCIPSKALLHNAELIHTIQTRGKEFGFSLSDIKVDYGVAFDRSRQVSSRLVKGVESLMRKNNIDVHTGVGIITDPNTVQVTLNAGGETTTFVYNSSGNLTARRLTAKRSSAISKPSRPRPYPAGPSSSEPARSALSSPMFGRAMG